MDYQLYVKKKHSFQDKIILCFLLPLFVVNIVFNSVTGHWNLAEMVLKIIALAVYSLSVYFYGKVFKSEANLWVFVIAMSYILFI